MINTLGDADRIQEQYKIRLDTMTALAEDWISVFKSDIRSNSTSTQLIDLLINFSRFARAYFEYFARPTYTSGSTAVENIAHTLDYTLEALQREWANIGRVCAQRSIPLYRPYLEAADRLAEVYHSRFKGTHRAKPIVFFEKIYSITRYPFMPLAIVSIPLQYHRDRNSWLSLSHELGHHIYWNSVDLEDFAACHRRLQNNLLQALTQLRIAREYDSFVRVQPLVSLWMDWHEEIFADVCGTMMAGPAFFHSSLELAKAAGEVHTHDGEHPAAYLRPLIAIETMQWVQERYAEHANAGALATKISAANDAWGKAFPADDTRGLVEKTTGLTMSELAEFVHAVVHTILGDEQDTNREKAWLWRNPETHENEQIDLGVLFDPTPWLDALPDGENFQTMQPIVGVLEVQTQAEDNPFEAYRHYLVTQLMEQDGLDESTASQKLRETLLQYQLSHEDGGSTPGGPTIPTSPRKPPTTPKPPKSQNPPQPPRNQPHG